MSLFKSRTLHRIRKKRKYKPHELADAVGISWSAIYKYEDGTRTPTISTLEKMAKVLDIDYRILLRKPYERKQ